jgi:Protein of unknown function (DUF4238)
MPAKRHHYVPRFHLANFATMDSERHIYQYFKDSRSPVRASVKDVGCKKGFYSLPKSDDKKTLDHEVIEKPLAIFDDCGSKAINHLLSFNLLGNDGLEVFCHYVATLIVRTPACYSRAEQMLLPDGQEIFERIVKYNAEFRNDLEAEFVGKGEMTQNEFKSFLDNIANGGALITPTRFAILKCCLTQIEEIANTIKSMNWFYLIPKEQTDEFLISDQPAFYCDPVHNRNSGVGLATPTIELIVPLSKKMCAIGFRADAVKEAFYEIFSESVNEINRRSIISAENFAFASKLDDKLKTEVARFKDSSMKTVVDRVRDFPNSGNLMHIARSVFPVTGFRPVVLAAKQN